MDKFIIIIISALVIIFNSYYNSTMPNADDDDDKEGYSNYMLDQADGIVPDAQTKALVQETYPITGKNMITKNEASDVWQWYPTFKLGSYDQITNNIRYPNRPSNGTCVPSSMCGAFYKETNKFAGKNYTYPLPPAGNYGTRVGYFNAQTETLVL